MVVWIQGAARIWLVQRCLCATLCEKNPHGPENCESDPTGGNNNQHVDHVLLSPLAPLGGKKGSNVQECSRDI